MIKITAAVIVTACVEIILPIGKIRSSCKTVLTLVCLAVMIEPLTILLKTDFSFFNKDEVDYSYLEGVDKLYSNMCEKEIVAVVEELGAEVVGCEVEGKNENGVFCVEKIKVEIKNSVISEKDEHIISIEEMRKHLADKLSVSIERIEVYGKK